MKSEGKRLLVYGPYSLVWNLLWYGVFDNEPRSGSHSRVSAVELNKVGSVLIVIIQSEE